MASGAGESILQLVQQGNWQLPFQVHQPAKKGAKKWPKFRRRRSFTHKAPTTPARELNGWTLLRLKRSFMHLSLSGAHDWQAGRTGRPAVWRRELKRAERRLHAKGESLFVGAGARVKTQRRQLRKGSRVSSFAACKMQPSKWSAKAGCGAERLIMRAAGKRRTGFDLERAEPSRASPKIELPASG